MLTMASSTGVCLNGLLAGLPEVVWGRLGRHLIPAFLPLGKVLYEPGAQLDEIYFPTTAIVSLDYAEVTGASAEMAVVGNEGMVGVALFMGGDTTSSRAVVDGPGSALRLKARILSDEFYRGGAMQDRLLRYTQTLITQMAQTAVCNRHHSVDQQTCRWLLGRLDRRHSSELIATQELIAARLGVRRESVASVAVSLQDAGLIRYHRGHIFVLDRPALEERCCECYAVVKQETDRLLENPARLADTALQSAMHRRARSLVEPHRPRDTYPVGAHRK